MGLQAGGPWNVSILAMEPCCGDGVGPPGGPKAQGGFLRAPGKVLGGGGGGGGNQREDYF